MVKITTRHQGYVSLFCGFSWLNGEGVSEPSPTWAKSIHYSLLETYGVAMEDRDA
jgi:hypothetical protein